jgi:16S rRNA (cytidine1402-2'-O)-methyltransferase
MSETGALPAPAGPGRLVLIPNALDQGTGQTLPLDGLLSAMTLRRAAALQHWVVEDARSARQFLARVREITPLAQPLQALDIQELPRPPKGGAARQRVPEDAWHAMLGPALAGADIGLLSEAGMPAVADPGSELVAMAHQLAVPVEPHPGPSALLMALAASGLSGQNFAFVGYLPVEEAARQARIRELENLSRHSGQAQMAIETPYRNAAFLAALCASLQPTTRLAIACGLSLPGGWVRTQPISAWRKTPPHFEPRWPAVFIWQA